MLENGIFNVGFRRIECTLSDFSTYERLDLPELRFRCTKSSNMPEKYQRIEFRCDCPVPYSIMKIHI